MKPFYPIIVGLFLMLCGVSTFQVQAQNFPLDRIYQQGYPQTNNYQSSNVLFYFYEYESEQLDLRHFRLSNPMLRLILPKKVKVKLPPLKWAKDTTYAVGYMTNGDAKDGSLILMIIGDASTNRPTFFVDRNLDQDFSDEKPIIFTNDNKKYRNVTIKDRFDKQKRYDFLLLNPLHQDNIPVESKEIPVEDQEVLEEDIASIPEQLPENPKYNIKHFNKSSFSLNVNGFIGAGKLRYQYETPVDYYPYVEYELNYVPKGFGLEVGYVYKNIQLNFVGTYENIYYYTSTLNEDYQPYINGEGQLKNPAKTLTNIDYVPRKKYSYGLDLGYNFNLGDKTALMPFVQYTNYNYDENFYNADVRKEDQSYPFEERYALGGGLTLKMMLNPKSMLTYKVLYQRVNFDPVGFFQTEQMENFELEQEQVLISVGYTLKLF
ncbi:MAG: hypothetical protein AB8B69_24730 [Chitinophagales bacterium]